MLLTTPASFCSVHFHNLDSGVTSVQLLSDDNSGFTSPTTRATFTVSSPSFYATFASASERYWRLKFTGTNGSPICIGKWILGTLFTLSEVQRADWSINYTMRQLAPLGGLRVNQAASPTRVLSMDWLTESAEHTELLTMLTAGAWGSAPVSVVVPDTSERAVLMGSWSASVDVARGSGGLYGAPLEFEEQPGPRVISA